MMSPVVSDKPSVLEIVRLAWSDLGRAILVMPWILPVAVVVVVAIVLARSALGVAEERSGAALAAELALNAILTALLAPVCIAIQRAIILGEITPAYRFSPFDARLVRVIGWSMLFVVAYSVPEAAALATSRDGGAFVFLPLFTAAIMLSVRLVVLLPAVAVDAPGASFGGALADTRDHAWRILAVILLLMLPLYAVVALAGLSGVGSTGTMVVSAVTALLVEGLLQSNAARFYRWIGDQVGKPAT
jgi:hypothetical membrane protein